MEFVDFYSTASFERILRSASRQLLSSSTSIETDPQQRLADDAQRTVQFLFSFMTFCVLWCTLSCYVYHRPFDSPSGNSMVSCIRRTPFMRWFFRQSEKQRTPQNRDEDSTDIERQSLVSETNKSQTSGESAEKKTTLVNGPVSSSSPSPPTTTTTYLFGSENSTLIVCCIGLLIAYLTWGFLQERIMGHPYGDADDEDAWFKHSSFCVLINRLFGVVVSSVALQFVPRTGSAAPPYVISLCALSNMSSSWLQYEALHYVTFPVQTIFKSGKVLITMGVGKLVLKKTFPLQKYLNALVIGVGVYIFLSAQKQSKSKSNSDELGMYFYLGLALTSGYAFCDAFTSNWQSRIFKSTGMGPIQMMQSVNCFTLVVSLCFCFKDLPEIYLFYAQHPAIILHSLLMGLCAGFGQVLIFYTIRTFGPMKFAAIMTTRMILSILISIVHYGHALTTTGAIGMCITFVALYYQTFTKGAEQKRPRSN